jgi:hypothetical protein
MKQHHCYSSRKQAKPQDSHTPIHNTRHCTPTIAALSIGSQSRAFPGNRHPQTHAQHLRTTHTQFHHMRCTTNVVNAQPAAWHTQQLTAINQPAREQLHANPPNISTSQLLLTSFRQKRCSTIHAVLPLCTSSSWVALLPPCMHSREQQQPPATYASLQPEHKHNLPILHYSLNINAITALDCAAAPGTRLAHHNTHQPAPC